MICADLIVANSRPLATYGLLSKVQKSVHWTLHFMIIFLSFSHTSAHPQECNRLTLLMPYPSWLARTAYNETWNVIEIKTHRPHTKVTWRKSERNYTLEVQCFRIFSKDFFSSLKLIFMKIREICLHSGFLANSFTSIWRTLFLWILTRKIIQNLQKKILKIFTLKSEFVWIFAPKITIRFCFSQNIKNREKYLHSS